MSLSKTYSKIYPHIMFVLAVYGALSIEDLQPGMGLLMILVGGLYMKSNT